jgi:outer membrane protein assembly factor BamB
VWAYRTGAQVQSDQILSVDGATVFIGSDDHHVYALDVASGKPAWNFSCGAEAQSGLTLSVDGSALYFGRCDGFPNDL